MDMSVPKMHAEAGFEVDESTPSLRVSGFFCLLFGLLSFVSTMGRPMLVFPLIAFVLGAVALRRFDGPTPVGIRAAMIGLVLAAGFGMCGLMLPWLKTRTLAKQAELFSRYYMEVIALEQDEFAMELNKEHFNRFPETMSLKEHYHADQQAYQRLVEFRDNSIHKTIRSRGVDAEWVLERPIRIYYSYQREHAEVIWMDPTGQASMKIRMVLDYRVDPDGQGQWHVASATPLSQAYVAEAVL
jgi:hypothetical protein